MDLDRIAIRQLRFVDSVTGTVLHNWYNPVLGRTCSIVMADHEGVIVMVGESRLDIATGTFLRQWTPIAHV